jgi:hypothetical protein
VGGSIWHFVGGLRNAPKGQKRIQAVSRVRARVPITGGSFAVWGVLFSCCDCTFTYIRKKVTEASSFVFALFRFLYVLSFSTYLGGSLECYYIWSSNRWYSCSSCWCKSCWKKCFSWWRNSGSNRRIKSFTSTCADAINGTKTNGTRY